MGVQINGDTGNISATKADYSGNVTIGGTLTYEDVTNIDSVGLITARDGIEVGARPGVAASISVDGNMIVSGISTFGGALSGTTGTFSGDVSIADKIVHTGDTNTAIRFPSADTLTAETGGSERLRIASDGTIGVGNDSPSTWGSGIPTVEFKGTSGSYTARAGAIAFESQSGSNGYNLLFSEGGNLLLYSGATNRASATERFRIASGGDVTVSTGNLVIGTAGKGIDFSAQTSTSASGASATSELLDHYEEGTWTPAYESTGGTYAYTTQTGYYTKVGNVVSVAAYIKTSSVSASSHNLVKVTGLPFAEGKSQRTPGSVRAAAFQSSGTLAGFPVAWTVEAGQTFGELLNFTSTGLGDFTSGTMNNVTMVYLQATYHTA